jgi:hypothetical protein
MGDGDAAMAGRRWSMVGVGFCHFLSDEYFP